MKVRKKPVEVFSQWVETGKDEGMEKNHRKAVEAMLAYATKELNSFAFIDAGCGNGWVVREVAKAANCKSAIGIDGSKNMIAKAKKLDPNNTYIHSDLLEWIPQTKVDLVHSMEVFYYLENPEELISHINDYWLSDKGRLIIGLDFYTENKVSHSWPEDCGISVMTLLPIASWETYFKIAGFKDVRSWQLGSKDGWAGSLIVTGVK
ncbi:MAG: class I SAM-dependent methyltransferase [Flavobacteriaceae bacterium TMED120]|jgi:predicted TPR repeat methyltransferase|nr:MAG: class I SAM-dependent methyltransferase [Flavobacteriaceae bacterium TMED120]CAI8256337.1 MAG: Trans-aconitate 2-methyltransferase [Flavobacteriaceae bacterium]HCQ24595.1 nodulation protein S NodS [Flavobacteriaceae bacterium]|tara:strand:- start:10 stop:627 length:618 start_codon:yes stop_codon:yes gene_type:complete